MPHQVLLGMTILLNSSSRAINLVNGFGNCLAVDTNFNQLVTAECKAVLDQQWEFRLDDEHSSRLCNGFKLCAMKTEGGGDLVFCLPSSGSTDGLPSQNWDLTLWGALVNDEQQCLGSSNITDRDPLLTVPCDMKAPGQLWTKKFILA